MYASKSRRTYVRTQSTPIVEPCIFAKCSILDVGQGSEYASEEYLATWYEGNVQILVAYVCIWVANYFGIIDTKHLTEKSSFILFDNILYANDKIYVNRVPCI